MPSDREATRRGGPRQLLNVAAVNRAPGDVLEHPDELENVRLHLRNLASLFPLGCPAGNPSEYGWLGQGWKLAGVAPI